MEKSFIALINSIPTFLSNTHFDIHLQGWPAAAAIFSICFAGVSICAIVVNQPSDPSDSENNYILSNNHLEN